MKTRIANGLPATLALFVTAGLAAGVASAGPDGAVVTAGSASFSTNGATTTINAANGTIINYNSFNIGASETVNFVQPSANAAVLNRILGGSPTNIDGTLTANGRVYFVNPSGVMFGQNAVVNVGHLYAAAANLSDSDFLAGRNNFRGASGTVSNYGQINGDFVSLIGARVANYGTITAPHGTVVMAAGNDVYLSERLGQWHVKVERAATPSTPSGGSGLAAGDMYTIAAWHDGTTTARNITVASAGGTTIAGTFNATDATGGLLTISGDSFQIGNSANALAGDTIIDETTVEAALNSGLDFTVDADGSITLASGTSLDKTTGGEATLTLSALSAITLDGSILNTSGGSLHLNLDAGTSLALNGAINAGGGAVSMVGSTVSLGSGVTLRGGVLEVRGSSSISGDATLVSDGTIGGLSADGFAALSDGLRAEILGTPENNDFGMLLTGPSITLGGPSMQTNNSGGLRLFSTGAITLNPNAAIILDGRFHQEGPAAVSLGGQITTTGDDVLFAGNLTLTNDLLISANNGSNATPLIGFEGTVDGNYFLSADAGKGAIIALQDLGSSSALNTLRMRGMTVDLYGDATSHYAQDYIVGTLTLHGSDLTTFDTTQPIGLEQSAIEVYADLDSGFAGNLVLDGDSILTTAGSSADARGNDFGDQVAIAGTVNSSAGGLHTLIIDSGNARTMFGGTVGTGVNNAGTLGFLEVHAAETQLFGSVYTNGMSFYSPVAVHADQSTIHTGTGVAWFGGNVYSAALEANDVSFQYSGDPTVALGSNRTPFKFTGHVGDNGGYGGEDALSVGFGGGFGSIQFGSNRNTPADAASFLFAANALPGEALTPGYSAEDSYLVYAYDDITMGRGEKFTAFGSLAINTGGQSVGTVRLGDINVLGDLTVDTQNLVFNARTPGLIEGVSTEQDRINEQTPSLTQDIAMELIVSGDINLFAENISVNAQGDNDLVLALSSAGLQALGANGFEPAGEISEGELDIPNPIDQSLFESLFGGNELRGVDGLLYAYDLAVAGAPIAPEIDPNLGLGFNGVDQFNPRYAGRYLPGQEVLSELALSPRNDSLLSYRNQAVSGTAIVADIPSTPNPKLGDYSITLSRLSKGAVDRLENRYVALFGERLDDKSDARANTDALQARIASAWTRYRSAGGSDPIGFAAWAVEADPAFLDVLRQIRGLVAAVDGLGLTRMDKLRAEARVIERCRPTGLEFGVIERMLQGLDQLVIPEPGKSGNRVAQR